MQICGSTLTVEEIDLTRVVTKVQSPAEARALPKGTVVGDVHGGVTFRDDVATVLERRSQTGWLHVDAPDHSAAWTLIVITR